MRIFRLGFLFLCSHLGALTPDEALEKSKTYLEDSKVWRPQSVDIDGLMIKTPGQPDNIPRKRVLPVDWTSGRPKVSWPLDDKPVFSFDQEPGFSYGSIKDFKLEGATGEIYLYTLEKISKEGDRSWETLEIDRDKGYLRRWTFRAEPKWPLLEIMNLEKVFRLGNEGYWEESLFIMEMKANPILVVPFHIKMRASWLDYSYYRKNETEKK